MKKYSQIVILVVFLSALFLNLRCKKDDGQCLTCPPPATNCEYPPGNRNFTWRLDTVAWFPSTVAGVWAFSDSDAYVMGTIVDGKPPYKSRPGRHWNGKIWENNINGTWDTTITPDPNVTIKIAPRNDITGDDHYLVAVGNCAPTGYIAAGIAEFDNKIKNWKSYQLTALGELRSVWTDGNGYFIAVGDNGMVYTNDGYTADWVFIKVPTDFHFYKMSGVSKNEIYLLGYKATGGYTYNQIWRYDGINWLKLLDDVDSVATAIKIPGAEHVICDLYANRCSISDSLKLYIVGWESNLFETIGSSLIFKKTNLSDLGLSLNSIGRTAQRIFGFSPNDYWIFGSGYNYYHWNGSSFMKMAIPGFPTSIDDSGNYRTMIKTKTGKIFFPSEVSSQVYVVVQGIP
jgi:hypothetical protein